MIDTSLITVQPTIRTKGFGSDNLAAVEDRVQLDRTVKLLESEMKSLHRDTLSKRDQEIIYTTLSAYHRALAGQPARDVDFVLSRHEILELERLPVEKTLRYVAYRYRYNKNPELNITEDYPPCVQIEPTSICNFRCVMCYQADATFNKKSKGFMGNMTFNFYKKLIDELEGNVEAITLASRGEPTMCPDLPRMLEYSRGKFLGLKLNTNASLLTEKMIHILLSAELQTLVFSIDAADKEAYEKIRVRGKFEKTISNLKLFAKIRARDYPKCQTIVRISGVKINNDQNIGKMENVWSEFADMLAFTNYNPWQNAYDNPVNEIEAPCTELWRRLFVWWDGKVNPCDYDYKSTLSKWNISDENGGANSVKAVWTSEFYQDMRTKHLGGKRGEFEPCIRCIAG